MWLICLAFGGSKTHNLGSWLRCEGIWDLDWEHGTTTTALEGLLFGIMERSKGTLNNQQPWKAYIWDWCLIDTLGWLCQERVLIPPQQSCIPLVKCSRSEHLIKGFNQLNWCICVPFLLLHSFVKKSKMHEYSLGRLSLCNQGEQGCGFG
jgi:hypothetical protein